MQMHVVYFSQCLEFQPPHAACDITFTSINSLASTENSIHWIPVINFFTFLLEKNQFSIIYMREIHLLPEK